MKKLIKLTCFFALLFALTACGSSEKALDHQNEIVLTDHLGREVRLEQPAKTVVSSYYISTTTLIALGAEDQLTGVEMKADTREIYKLAAPRILELPAMGNKKNFNIEECAELNPDLVVLPMGLKDYTAQLEELNIPTLVVNPETMEGFLDSVTMLGKATGHEEEAQELLDYYKDTQEEMGKELDGINTQKTVYFSSGSDVLRSATAKMFQNEIVTAAKGKSVFSGLHDMGWTAISAEQLLAYDPEYIFMENGAETNAQAFLKEPGFASLRAAAQDKVYAFPSKLETWDTPGPSSVLGILWMSSILYPNEITMKEVEAEAEAFYEKFFDIEVTAQQLGI